MYQENALQPLRFGCGERISPLLSYTRFPKEIINPPREWVERVFNVARWTRNAGRRPLRGAGAASGAGERHT
jgi:hypothetical protein